MIDGGLMRYRDGAFDAIALPSATVRALHEARDGTLWVAMDRGWRACVWRSAEVVETFAATYVYAFHEDPDGSMWLGTSNGLYVHRGGRVRPAGRQLWLPGHPVYAIWRGADQVLWVGTDGRWRSTGFVDRPPRPSRARRTHLERAGRSAGTVWIAGDHGLKSLRGHGCRRAFGDQDLSGRVLTAVRGPRGQPLGRHAVQR